LRAVGVYEAKTQFSKLLEAVAEGETITITRHGAPVAELRPIGKRRSPEEIADSIAAWRRYRREHNITLGGLSIEELIEEGRPS
jgi:prevent-host-death family protein